MPVLHLLTLEHLAFEGPTTRPSGLRGCGLDKQLPLLPNKTSFRYRYVQGSAEPAASE